MLLVVLTWRGVEGLGLGLTLLVVLAWRAIRKNVVFPRPPAGHPRKNAHLASNPACARPHPRKKRQAGKHQVQTPPTKNVESLIHDSPRNAALLVRS